MIFASKSRKGFYDSGVHGVLPEDAVEISEDYHKHLLEGQAIGGLIGRSCLPERTLHPELKEVILSNRQPKQT